MNSDEHKIYQLYVESSNTLNLDDLRSKSRERGNILIFDTLGNSLINRPNRDPNLYPNVSYIAVHPNGDLFFYESLKDKKRRHRLDGPAIQTQRACKFWIHGEQFSEEEYWKQPEVLALKKVKPEDKEAMSDLLNI